MYSKRRRDGSREFMRFVDELESIIEAPDWKDRVLAVLPAFSNARKTAIHSVLNKGGEISVEVLAERSFMPVETCYRIVGELTALGFLRSSAGATVSAAPQDERFAKTFLEFTNINSHKL